MATFDIKDNFTKIPNELFEIGKDIKCCSYCVLMFAARKTIGFGKKRDKISLSQFVKGTGLSKKTVIDALKELEAKKIIKIRRGKSKNGGNSIKTIEIDFNSFGGVNFTPLYRGDGCIFKPTKERYNNDNKKGVSKVTKKNIFFTLSDEQKKIYIGKFIKEILTKEKFILNPAAYEQKIREKFEKKDKAQLESFENWYLKAECLRLLEKYQEANIKVKEFGIFTIKSIYPYFKTVGYGKGEVVEDKIFVSLEEVPINNEDIKGFNTVKELEDFINEGVKDFFEFINPQ